MTTIEHTKELPQVVMRFIEEAGNMTQSLGVGRVLGQIYAFLYFSSQPRNLADMQHTLGISKGSASTGVRQLEQWGAVRKIWVKGDRKDYYQASEWFGRILKNAVVDTVGKKISSSAAVLDDFEGGVMDLDEANGDLSFINERVKHLRKFQKRLQGAWGSAILQKLLK